METPTGHRRGALEFGNKTEADVRSHDDMRYMVLPLRPAGTAHLGEEQLAQPVTRDSLIGVALASAPAQAG